MLQPLLLQALLLAPQPVAPPSMAAPALGDEWIIQSGTTETYDTTLGRLVLERLRIEAGGTLRVFGPDPFVLIASKSVEIEGLLDLSGFDSPGVTTLNTTNIPEAGADGGPGGGAGGTGSRLTDASTPVGDPGTDENGASVGGGGGETSYAATGKNDRRGAGGGGGALGPDQPIGSDPWKNAGLVAEDGRPGGPGGLGALSQSQRAAGGAKGSIPFVDSDPTNDFWGRKVDAGNVIVGELAAPLGGRGGGAGGDAVNSSSFPLLPFSPFGDEKGAGGGGGGGLGLVLTRTLVVGGEGRILAEGGTGGGGENTNFFDRVGGGSGGGSGGMLVLEARTIDLSGAKKEALSARGGTAGEGKDNVLWRTGGGGNGGPGIIQLHIADPTNLLLPANKTLDFLSAPDAHVLLPILGK